MEFKTWIEVSIHRMETLKALDLPDVFATEPGAGRIRVVEQSEICASALHQWNKEQPTLAILPTSRPLVSFHPNVHVVPYSDHSSYQELEDFVSALKPTCLIPIVGSCVPGSLHALLPRKKRHEILVPESVRQYMLRDHERQLSSSAYTSLHRRHFQPLVPKGVVFESPVRGSRKSCEEVWEAECLEEDGSEEEMDTESSDKDSDCILVDLSKELTASKNGRGAGDMWNLNTVQTVPEEMAMAKIISNQHSDCVTVQSSHTSPDEDAVSQNSPDDSSCASSSSLTELPHEYIEKLENRLLKNLPFSEEDFKTCGLLQKSFVQQFALSPLRSSKEDDLSD